MCNALSKTYIKEKTILIKQWLKAYVVLLCVFLCIGLIHSASASTSPEVYPASPTSSIPKFSLTQTLPSSALSEFNENPTKTQRLIQRALSLAGQHLSYRYGSANPNKGGMDCSGTIQYLLKSEGLTHIPRQANTLYRWVWQKGHFYAVNSHRPNSFEFQHLKPGDLLFWSGTYAVKRDPPVTHVMLYLGRDKHGQRLMFGSSEGRSYQGFPMKGVSVFDFKLPRTQSHARFLGYSCIPGINCKL